MTTPLLLLRLSSLTLVSPTTLLATCWLLALLAWPLLRLVVLMLPLLQLSWTSLMVLLLLQLSWTCWMVVSLPRLSWTTCKVLPAVFRPSWMLRLLMVTTWTTWLVSRLLTVFLKTMVLITTCSLSLTSLTVHQSYWQDLLKLKADDWSTNSCSSGWCHWI